MRFLLVVPLLASLAGATPAPEGECEQFPGHRFKGVDGLSFARSDDFLVGQALSPVTAGSSRRLVAANAALWGGQFCQAILPAAGV